MAFSDEDHPTTGIFGSPAARRRLFGSMGRVASSVDNGVIESFWSTMQLNCSTERPGPPAATSDRRSSIGSKPSTTPAGVNPRSTTSASPTSEDLHTAAFNTA
jgi:transposase InsO family protein